MSYNTEMDRQYKRGLAEGWRKGIAEGKARGSGQVNKLIKVLMSEIWWAWKVSRRWVLSERINEKIRNNGVNILLRKSVGCKKMSHIFFKIRNSYGNYIKQKFSKGLQRRIFKTKLKKLAVSLCKFCGKVLINRNNIKKKIFI